jgi:hypothetical protein
VPPNQAGFSRCGTIRQEEMSFSANCWMTNPPLTLSDQSLS